MPNRLNVRVIPRANKNQIVEKLDDGTFKIRIKAPPIDGKANKELISFLSSVLKIPKTEIFIAAGESSRQKQIEFRGRDLDQVIKKLINTLENG